MILTVSTVKDTPDNVAAFVRRNLAAGVDHVLLFLDAPDQQVQALLDEHPHATAIVCDDAYWTPERPESLNARQVTNANLAMDALAGLGWADWLFHIDADEVLQIDRERLLGEVPADRSIVRVAPLEAISRMTWPGEVAHFKQMLDKDTVATLVADGVIEAPAPDEPANATYFRGHVQGKVGVRPALDTRLQLHRAVFWGDDDTVQPAFGAPWLAHLHYESQSGEEFVRKWLAHLDAGQVRFRPRRARLRERIEAVVGDRGLDEAGRQAALEAIYHDEIEDPYDELLARGLLVEPAPADYVPDGLSAAQRSELIAMLALGVAGDKRCPNPQLGERWPVDLAREQRADLGDDDPRAVALDRAIAAAEASMAARGVRRDPPRGAGRLGRLFGRR